MIYHIPESTVTKYIVMYSNAETRTNSICVLLGFDVGQRMLSNQTLGNGRLCNRTLPSSAACYVSTSICASATFLIRQAIDNCNEQ